jgi:hypothetical protein
MWKTGWIFHWGGNLSRTATGETISVTRNGPWRRGVSLAVPCASGRFFPSNHASCPSVQRLGKVFARRATLLRAWMAINLFRRMLDRYSSAV